jgi:glycosyltransferase involved in cell wall biosynthesis
MLNDSTKFISPTKTPEYLSAGRPVISTPIADVVSPYGDGGYVEIATDAEGFVKAAERLLETPKEDWRKKVDAFLSLQSWSLTYKGMMKQIVQTLSNKYAKPTAVRKLSTIE